MRTFAIFTILVLVVIIRGEEGSTETGCPGGICVQKASCLNETDNFNPSIESSLITLRIDDVDECSNYLMTCCKTEVNDIMEPPASKTYGEVCGQSNEKGLYYNLHSNETVTQFGEFPWVAYIATVNKTSSSPTFVCGGTLIHPWHVLTTGHNVEGKSNLIARFGEWDIGSDKEPYPHQDLNVIEIITHGSYKLLPIQNDIALLFLEKEVLYQPHIQPICLPQETDEFVGQCIANGWGTVKGTYATNMKKISLPVVPRARCERMLQYAGLGPTYRLPQGFMCAGGEADVDTCKGDGGSPLACRQPDGSFVLAGIVSWGIGCGGQDRPGVYVSVSNYVSWINEQIERTMLLLRIQPRTVQ